MNQARNLLRDDNVTNEDVEMNAFGPVGSPGLQPRRATPTRIDVILSNLRRGTDETLGLKPKFAEFA